MLLLDLFGAKAAILAWKEGAGEAVWSDALALLGGGKGDEPVLEALARLGCV